MTLCSKSYDSCHGPKLRSVSSQSAQLRPTGQLPVAPASNEQPSPAGRDINITWWYTFISIAGMAVFLLGLAAMVAVSLTYQFDGVGWQIVAVLVLFFGTAVTSIYASLLIRDGYGTGWPERKVTLCILAIPTLGWFVTLFIPGAALYGAIPLWITLSILLALIPRSHRWPTTAVGVLFVVLHGLLNPGTQDFLDGRFLLSISLFIVLTPSTLLFSGWLWHLIQRLDETRTVTSQLAVARERLRFASDLHDIQGHHLQVIALKAELAERLMASGTPEHQQAAQDAIAEVRTIAAEAQSETRQLVRGLRVVSLADELENAKGVLEAAEITAKVQIADAVDTSATLETNRLLGLAVREATTNILRHANATTVSIQVQSSSDALQLTIFNDGVPESDPSTQGTGLEGLRTRFRAAGGVVTTSRTTDTFELQATLPHSLEESVR